MRAADRRHGTRPSLWLLPDDDRWLTERLASLAAAHDGPVFAPHLTLLGSVFGPPAALQEQTASLAAQLSPLRLPTAGVHGSEEWFRCITLQVDKRPPLQEARERAEEIFGADARPWTPHISLLYGHLTAAARSAALATLPPVPATVRLSTLALVETIGPAEAWTERARFPLARV